MGKSSKSLFIGALASSLLSGAAFAADYIPPPIIDFEPEYEAEFGGNLYLRGYIGFTNQEVDDLDNALFATSNVEFLNSEFEASGLIGGAVGYQFNQWFRTDVSAEYRMRAGYDGLDRYDENLDGDFVDANDGTNKYDADKSEFLVMANAFVDLGTYSRLTPYVGVGAGASYTMIDNFTDTNTPQSSVAYADDNGEWAFAWAVYAGLGFEVNERFTLDMGYRYLHLGDAASGDIDSTAIAGTVENPMEFNGISSHDFTLGFRYALGPVGGGHGSSTGMLSY